MSLVPIRTDAGTVYINPVKVAMVSESISPSGNSYIHIEGHKISYSDKTAQVVASINRNMPQEPPILL